MGLLAYDPERVAYLKHHLVAAVEELRAIRCGDPTAVDAMRSVASIRNEIELVWLPLIAQILDNTALTRAWWYFAGLTDNLQNALINVMADGYGWAVQRDPLNDDPTVVTAAEARALGAMLNSADLLNLARDHEQLRWLTQQLQIIGRNRALSAEFLANFDSWKTVTDVLGLEYARAGRPEIATVFDGLMQVWTTTLAPGALTAGKSATLDVLLPPIDDVDPYVQALMVRSLRPDAMTVATLAHELLTNWLALKNDSTAPTTIDRQVGPGPNAADVLLPLLLDNPAACVWFTELAARRPAILFETLNDPDLAYQVILVGTDPTNTTSDAAGRAVLAILDYFRTDPYQRSGFDNDGHPGEYGAFLGNLAAPWLTQFTMSNDDWDASAGAKAAALRVALHDEQALQQLAADAERIHLGFLDSLSKHDMTAANQVGELLNLVLQLSVNERVDDEIASTDERFNLMWTVVGVASSFLPGGPLVGIATGFALTALGNQLNAYLGQPDPTGVRRSAERTMDVALTLAGADAISRLFQQWIADGRIDASHPLPPIVNVGASASWCPSAEYHDTFTQWRSGLPGGANGELSRQASDLLAAFVGSSEAQSNCAEIAG
ncbi:MAG: hypothetical protein K8R99_10325 [Actinomycetia bacterium]|nr:hypothetical protein [Actinomycetes bacterium]